jgi:hypothetical protein
VTDLTPERVREMRNRALRNHDPIGIAFSEEESAVAPRIAQMFAEDWLRQHATIDRLRAELREACGLVAIGQERIHGDVCSIGCEHPDCITMRAFLARQEKP